MCLFKQREAKPPFLFTRKKFIKKPPHFRCGGFSFLCFNLSQKILIRWAVGNVLISIG